MAATMGQKVIVVLSFLVFILVAVLNALSANRSDSWIFVHLFNNRSNTDVSKVFQVNITPAGYAFSIWGLIYAWQAAWLIYALTTVFRRSAPLVLGYGYYAAFIVGCILNVTWLVVFSREKATGSFVVIAFDWCALATAVVLSYFDVEKNQPELQKDHPKELLILRLLVQNGVSIITSWTTVATCLNLSIMLVYGGPGLSQTAACSIALSVLAVILIAYYVLENFVFSNALRYTFVPWLVVIWALTAILVKNYNSSIPETVFALVLVIVVCVLLIIRIILLIVRPSSRGNWWNGMQMV